MPQPTREEIIVDEFWQEEARIGYEIALTLIAERFGITCADVEKLVIWDDALNTGNQ